MCTSSKTHKSVLNREHLFLFCGNLNEAILSILATVIIKYLLEVVFVNKNSENFIFVLKSIVKTL